MSRIFTVVKRTAPVRHDLIQTCLRICRRGELVIALQLAFADLPADRGECFDHRIIVQQTFLSEQFRQSEGRQRLVALRHHIIEIPAELCFQLPQRLFIFRIGCRFFRFHRRTHPVHIELQRRLIHFLRHAVLERELSERLEIFVPQRDPVRKFHPVMLVRFCRIRTPDRLIERIALFFCGIFTRNADPVPAQHFLR